MQAAVHVIDTPIPAFVVALVAVTLLGIVAYVVWRLIRGSGAT